MQFTLIAVTRIKSRIASVSELMVDMADKIFAVMVPKEKQIEIKMSVKLLIANIPNCLGRNEVNWKKLGI